MNVIFEVKHGRRFLTRKAIDVASSIVLMVLVLATLVLVFVGGRFADDLLGFIGIGGDGADLEPRPLAPGGRGVDARLRGHLLRDARRAAPLVPLRAARARSSPWCFGSSPRSRSRPTSPRVADVGALYGAFAGAIVLVGWMWLSNVALLFGAELNAEVGRQKELDAGIPHHETCEFAARRG